MNQKPSPALAPTATPTNTQPQNSTFAPPSGQPVRRPAFRRLTAEDLVPVILATLVKVWVAGRKVVARAERRAGRARMRVRTAVSRMATRSVEHDEAVELQKVRAQRLESDALYDIDGPGARAIGTPAYLAVAGLCFAADVLVDQGALQVLRLPMRTTMLLAIVVAIFQLVVAHWAGVAAKRASGYLDGFSAAADRRQSAVLTTVGLVVAVCLGAFRYVYTGSALSALLFCALAVGAFLVMRYVAKLHHSVAHSEASKARRKRWWTGRLLLGAERGVERAHARLRDRHDAVIRSYVTELIVPADAVLAEGHRKAAAVGVAAPEVPEPAWLADARAIVAGDAVPAYARQPLTAGGQS